MLAYIMHIYQHHGSYGLWLKCNSSTPHVSFSSLSRCHRIFSSRRSRPFGGCALFSGAMGLIDVDEYDEYMGYIDIYIYRCPKKLVAQL